MKLETLKLADIVPYKKNPRKNDSAVNAVAESIRQCTYITPIIVDEEHVIIAGHTRYKALKALGYEEAQCLICDGLTEEQKKKYRYLDNKTGEKATWDLMKLEVELEGLDLEGFDFFGTDQGGEPGAVGNRELLGSAELEAEDFGDEKFKYTCPACGFRFN